MAMQTKTIDIFITDKHDHSFNSKPEVFNHSSLFITSAKEVMFFARLCLFVCVSAR